jgi:hypothetical protein
MKNLFFHQLHLTILHSQLLSSCGAKFYDCDVKFHLVGNLMGGGKVGHHPLMKGKPKPTVMKLQLQTLIM